MENYICYYDTDPKRPCPECGSRVLSYESTRYKPKTREALDVYIICRNCGCRSHVRRNVEEAVKEWNGMYRKEG